MRNSCRRRTARIGRLASAVALAAALVPWSCHALVRSASEEARPLSFVGDMTFCEPQAGEKGVVVPVRFSGGAWVDHSGIVPARIA